MSSTSSPSGGFEVVHPEQAQLIPADLNRVRAWLRPTNYEASSSEFHLHRTSQAPGTGRWVLETPTFQQWRNALNQGSLWVKGPPGSGKSVMTAALVDHMRSLENVAVLFFFFRDIISTNRTPRSLTRDWLAQLLPYSIGLQHHLLALAKKELDLLSTTELWSLLLKHLASIDKAYCFIDALDEMEQPADKSFLKRLNELSAFKPSAIKVFITSRPKQYLQRALTDTSILHINLQKELVERDIEAFVTYRLRESISKDAARMPLASIITAKSQGLFLYARLLLEQVIEHWPQIESKDAKSWAESLPVGLAQMYDNVLERRASTVREGAEIQRLILQFITHSSRACRLSEIAEILRWEFPELETPKEIARTICSPLLEVLEDETVQIIHHSMTEFLLGSKEGHVLEARNRRRFTPVLSHLQAHRRLAMICVDYLMSGVLLITEETRRSERDQRVCTCHYGCTRAEHRVDIYDHQAGYLRYPLLSYAMRGWLYHAGKYNKKDTELHVKLDHFFNSQHFRNWASAMWSSDLEDGDNRRQLKELSKLHVSSLGGLSEFARYSLNTDEGSADDLDAVDEGGRTPLWWAARSGSAEMVSLLLEAGSDPDIGDVNGSTPLYEAVIQDNAAIAHILLEAGADMLAYITLECTEYGPPEGEIEHDEICPATKAVFLGHEAVVRAMIPYCSPKAAARMVFESCRMGNLETLQLLLDSSPAWTHSDVRGRLPLFCAAQAASVDCVKLLLNRGADVNSESVGSFEKMFDVRASPLVALFDFIDKRNSQEITKSLDILKLFIEAGIDIKDSHTLSGLLRQAHSPEIRRETLRILLEAGVDVKMKDDRGLPLLHRYLRDYADIRGVKTLLQHGADLSLDLGASSIWHSIFSASYSPAQVQSIDKMVRFLLDNGAGEVCHIVHTDSYTLPDSGLDSLNGLQRAALFKKCSLKSFAKMLKACKESEARTKCIWALGTWPSQAEADRYLKVLLSHGVSIEAQDQAGATPLLSCVADKDQFQRLLDHGANSRALDSQGRGVLHYFVASVIMTPTPNWRQRLDELLEMGFDLHCTDQREFNLLHTAAKHYHGHSAEWNGLIMALLEQGVDINGIDDLGRTPLLVFLEEGLSFGVHNYWGDRNVWSDDSWNTQISGLWSASDVNKQDKLGLSAFHHAAMNSEHCVMRLLGANADPSAVTHNQENALHLACRARCIDTVSLLLQHPRTMHLKDMRNNEGQTPLHLACRSGILDVVACLLESQVDVNAKDNLGRTPLHVCGENGREIQIWNNLNSSGYRLTDERLRPGLTRSSRFFTESIIKPLKAPECTNHSLHSKHKLQPVPAYMEKVVSTLRSSGANVMALDSQSRTPLEYALSLGCVTVAKTLEQGCSYVESSGNLTDVDEQISRKRKRSTKGDHSSLSSLRWPEKHIARWREVIGEESTTYLTTWYPKLNMQKGKERTMLKEGEKPYICKIMEHSVRKGRLRVVDKLKPLIELTYSAKKAHSSRMDGTLPLWQDNHILFCACERQESNMVMLKYLLDECGVDPNARGCLPYMLGEKNGLKPSSSNYSILHRLAPGERHWHLNAIRELVRCGADLESRGSYGETPLHASCSRKIDRYMMPYQTGWFNFWARDSAELLLDLGADPCAIDKAGISIAEKIQGFLPFMDVFVKKNVPISANEWLLSAVKGSSSEAVKLALSLGADPNMLDARKSIEMRRPLEPSFGDSDDLVTMERFVLLCAYKKDDTAVVRQLIEGGASLFSPIRTGLPLLHYMLETTDKNITNIALKSLSKDDLQRKDSAGRTLLHAACDNPFAERFCDGADEPIRFLMDLGADSLAIDNSGRNILHHVIEHTGWRIGRPQQHILQILDQRIARSLVCQRDGIGNTPLHDLLERFNMDNKHAMSLVERMAELSPAEYLRQADSKGRTGLHLIAAKYMLHEFRGTRALVENHYRTCQPLWHRFLAAGCNLDDRDADGNPPLFSYIRSVASRAHKERYNDLFADADPSALNNRGENALHILAKSIPREYRMESDRKIEQEFFEFMVAKGLDPLAEDAQGQSSLDAAAALGKEHILELFQYNA